MLSLASSRPGDSTTPGDAEKHIKVSLINKYLGRYNSKKSSSDKSSTGLTPQNTEGISPRLHYSNILTHHIPFEHQYSHTDLTEIESDTTVQLRKRYPNSLAFKHGSSTLNEKLLEFSLEEQLKFKGELVRQRRDALTSIEERKIFSHVPPSKNDLSSSSSDPIAATDVSDLKSLRKVRQNMIHECKTIPSIQFPQNDFDAFNQLIQSSLEKRNTAHFSKATLAQFYDDKLKALKLEKYRLLYRWSRFAETCEKSDRTEAILKTRLRKLHNDYATVKERLSHLKMSQTELSQLGHGKTETLVQKTDFESYVRTMLKDAALHKKLHAFLKKLQWLSYTERENLFKKCSQGIDRDNEPTPPLMTSSVEDIEDQLEELKECFDLTKINIEGGQEFLYAVTKRFAAVFHAQEDSLKFPEYPLTNMTQKQFDQYLASHTEDSSHHDMLQDASGGSDAQAPVANNPDKIYLKSVPWNTNNILKRRVSDRKQRQEVLQESVGDIDTMLRVEAGFLRESDLSYAQKRLRDQAETHLKRAHVQQTVNGEGDFRVPPLQGGRSSLTKLQSVYLLRYIRIREFRRKMLDLFNYFRSIQRKIALDSKGWGLTNDARKTFLARAFPAPHDLEPLNSDEIMNKTLLENRDDFYELKNNRDVLVRDATGHYIMYKTAFQDLETREEELLKLGSHFIIKAYDENHNVEVDRMLVVEDLYESETWFQDGKRKLIDCYMEAYEHCIDPKQQHHLAQVITDLLHSKPHIDMGAKYFSESYAAEIIGLELQHSLMRDVINAQMNSEKKYVKYLYRSFDPNTRKSTVGMPENLIDDPRLETRLFPGSSRVGYIDFYSSLSQIGFVYESIETAIDDLVFSFKIENPMVITSLKRSIIQQAIIEWKLLTEEEKIQKHIHMKLSDERQLVDDVLLMEDSEEIIGIIYEAIQDQIEVDEKQKVVDSSLFRGEGATSSSGDIARSLPTTEGGFPIPSNDAAARTEATTMQYFANALEMILTWKTLLDQLYETDVLYNIYTKQCTLIGEKLEDPGLVEPLNFEDDQRSGVSMVRTQEVVSIRSQFLSNIAIAEFEQSMADFNFNTALGLKRIMSTSGLSELRHALQFQIMQRILLQVVTQYNQVPLDDLFINGGNDNTFLTSVPKNAIQHIYETRTNENKVREVFVFVDNIKDELRQKVVRDYKKVSSQLSSESGTNVMIKSKLRELKFSLAGDYCKDMLLHLSPFIQKAQIVRHIGELRTKIMLLNEDNRGFTLGQENDRVPKTSRFVNTAQPVKQHAYSKDESTCLMAQDGTVSNCMYVPHYLQVMRMSFAAELSGTSRALSVEASKDLYSKMMRIVQCNYMIISFLIVQGHMAVSAHSSLTRVTLGLEQVGQQIHKIQNEVDHLNDPESCSNVANYLQDRAMGFYTKTLVTLRQLRLKLQLSHNNAAADKVHECYKELIDPITQTWSPMSAYYPLIDKLDAKSQSSYPLLLNAGQLLGGSPMGSRTQYNVLNRFLLEMSEAVRNTYNAEDMSVELILEDLLQRQKVYSTSMPEKAILLNNRLCQAMLQLWIIKDFIFALIRKHFTVEFMDNVEKMEELFNNVVIRESRRIYEQQISEHNRRVQMEFVKSSSTGGDDEKAREAQKQELDSKLKQKDELEFKDQQVEIAIQELNKLMIIELIDTLKMDVRQIRYELRSHNQEEQHDTHVKEVFHGAKLDIFRELLYSILHHGSKSRTKNNDVAITLLESHLQEALDMCGHKLLKWKEREMHEIVHNLNEVILHYKRLAFNNKEKYEYNNYLSDIDHKAFNRRIESEVADHNYDLVFQVDTVTRDNRDLSERLENVMAEVKEEVKKEYEDLVRQMAKELIVQKTRFNDFRQQYYKRLDEKFSDVKATTLVKIEDAKKAGGATLMQKQALKVVVEDNELAKLKRLHADSKAYEEKLIVMNKLKLLSVKGKLERQLVEAETEKESTNKMYWTNKAKIEERENMLRQELIKVQQELSNAQMEIGELKKEVNVQKKNKQKLRIWKVKNKQLLDELEHKVQSYEKWNKYDVDKLLLEKERLMQEVQKYAKMEVRLSKQSQIVERKSKRQVLEMKRRLVREQKLKTRAFSKLEEIRITDGDEPLDAVPALGGTPSARPSTGGGSGQWHRRYLDAMSELQLTIKENHILKEHMKHAGLDVPAAPSPASSRYPSRPTSIKRTTSGYSTAGILDSSSMSPSSSSKPLSIVPTYRSNPSTPTTPTRRSMSGASPATGPERSYEKRAGSAGAAVSRSRDVTRQSKSAHHHR
eukprot:CAMPEP_0117435588 /NCGR_PEP_ID=MMETSP0759-20121206/560_1 /TAXON_ID=63605 /ORGANISM="Percolomonas cosmopolitus, Strain WS" /LENGTH=2262 /DNA_ID=CAMNT_0005227143 /DNA_START=110 /DNA_END=6898 /DNA_ORIENTATION=+